MFERFDDDARRVIVLAQQESIQHRHSDIGVGHLLLGLIELGRGAAHEVLAAQDVDIDRARVAFTSIRSDGREKPRGHIPFTPGAKASLELALRFAVAVGSRELQPGHLLRGVLDVDDTIGRRVLTELGVDLEQLGEDLAELVGRPGPDFHPSTPGEAGGAPEVGGSSALPQCPGCRAPLDDALRTHVVEASSAEGDESIPTRVLACGRCGIAIGAWPA